MKKKRLIAIVVIVALAVVVSILWYKGYLGNKQQPIVLKPVVINEAARTLLYIPLYHAIEKGYFREAGLDVKVVTGGSATNSFAAMLSGEADFAQADPMYVPISREKGGQTKVVAQVVGRIAVWGVTFNPKINDITSSILKGKKVATHPRPMTAFTYTTKMIKDAGLEPDKDVAIIASIPGAELASLMNKDADLMMSVEPNISKALAQGAHVVISYPQLLGDQVFTGLMTREDYITQNRDVVISVVHAYQKALDDIRNNPSGALASAKIYFPQLEDVIIQTAIKRIIDEEVLPKNVLISEESWKKAIAVRVAAGDLKLASAREESCEIKLMEIAISH